MCIQHTKSTTNHPIDSFAPPFKDLTFTLKSDYWAV